MYVIVTNYGNWHRENLRSDRENTGNLNIQFEWVPCHGNSYILMYLMSANICAYHMTFHLSPQQFGE